KLFSFSAVLLLNVRIRRVVYTFFLKASKKEGRDVDNARDSYILNYYK
ncbi:MAG: hypothetical protein UT22_C0035G0006, partial [Parcubacteria group bacterium GW2011_GWC2_39_11]